MVNMFSNLSHFSEAVMQ